MASPIVFNKTLAAANAALIVASYSPGAANPLTLTTAAGVTVDTASSTNTSPGRRVIITSGGNDLGITFTVTGIGSSGGVITDTFAGASGGAAQSNLDFLTVTSITHTGSVAGTVTAGTNGVGSSPWFTTNWHATSLMAVSFGVELVSGAANFTIQHTYDDPNNTNLLTVYSTPFVPYPFNHPLIAAQTASAFGTYNDPIAAMRLLINSGTGQLRTRILQSSIG